MRMLRQQAGRHGKSVRTRGIFLLEMIVVVALMAVVALAAGNVIMLSFRLQKEARDHPTQVFKVDDAIDKMRRDVWGATAIRAKDDELEVETAGEVTTWQMTNAGAISRMQDGVITQRWQGMPLFHFELIDGGRAVALVRVTVDSKERGGRSDELTLVSQRILAGGGR